MVFEPCWVFSFSATSGRWVRDSWATWMTDSSDLSQVCQWLWLYKTALSSLASTEVKHVLGYWYLSMAIAICTGEATKQLGTIPQQVLQEPTVNIIQIPKSLKLRIWRVEEERGCCSFIQACKGGPAEELSSCLSLSSWGHTALHWDNPSLPAPELSFSSFASNWPVCPLCKLPNKSRKPFASSHFVWLCVVWNADSEVTQVPRTETWFWYHLHSPIEHLLH